MSTPPYINRDLNAPVRFQVTGRRHHWPGPIIAIAAAVAVTVVALAPQSERADAHGTNGHSGGAGAGSIATTVVTAPSLKVPEAIDRDPPTVMAIELPVKPRVTVHHPEALAAAMAGGASQNQVDWHRVTLESGDTLSGVLSRLGVGPRQVHDVVNAGADASRLNRLRPGETMRVGLADDGELQALIYEIDATRSLRIERDGAGFAVETTERELERRTAHASGTINSSLFLAGRRAGLSDRLTMALANVFGWDVDFVMDIRDGDRFTVIYEEHYIDGDKIGTGPILGAEFVNRGTVHRAVRYTDPEGNTDYYTPEGKSVRRQFLRTPVEFTRISSHFGTRRHPVLHTMREHRGVDYAAPTGTPVRAAGEGRIIRRSRHGGYGNTVEIRHGNRYSTLYAHLSRYASGISVGSRVKQGQVIGYVGQTGMATGPHLHYEFRVDGVHRNPVTVDLPKADPLPEQHQDHFAESIQALAHSLDILGHVHVAAEDD